MGFCEEKKKKQKVLWLISLSDTYFQKHQFQLYKNKWENKYTKELLYKLTKVTYNIYVVYTGQILCNGNYKFNIYFI